MLCVPRLLCTIPPLIKLYFISLAFYTPRRVFLALSDRFAFLVNCSTGIDIEYCFEQKEIIFFRPQTAAPFVFPSSPNRTTPVLYLGRSLGTELHRTIFISVGYSLAIQNDSLFESIALQNISFVPTAFLSSTALQQASFKPASISSAFAKITSPSVILFLFFSCLHLYSQSSTDRCTTDPLCLRRRRRKKPLRISTHATCNHGSSPARVRRC